MVYRLRGEDRDIVNNITVSACVMLTTANPRSNDLDKLRSNAIFTKDISFTNHVIENQTEDYAGNINSYADSIKAENLNISKGKLYLVLYNTTVTSEYYSCSFEGNANITIHKSAAKIESENSTETTGTENVHTAKNPTMKSSVYTIAAGKQVYLFNYDDDIHDGDDYTKSYFTNGKNFITIGNYLWKDITWKSSNSKIVSVQNGVKSNDYEGWMAAKKIGTCTISATLKDGTVLKRKVKVTGAKITVPSTVTLKYKGYKEIGDCTENPYTVSITSATSSNSKVAKFYKSCYYNYDNRENAIVAKGNGTCTITLKFSDGQTKKIKVTVGAATLENKLEASKVYAYAYEMLTSYKYDSSGNKYLSMPVDFTNNSGKRVSYVDFTLYQYDNKGSRLSGAASYNYNGTIPKDRSALTSCKVNMSTKKARACVKKVYFEDGTTWTNSYYIQWNKKYSSKY